MHEAQALGMHPVVPDHSTLERGDWLVVPSRVDRQRVRLDPAVYEPHGVVAVDSPPPLFTTWGFYGGSLPLAHATAPRIELALFRVRRTAVAVSDWSIRELADWALGAGGLQAAWAAPALCRELRDNPEAAARILAARSLGALGGRAATSAACLAGAVLDDPDHRVREQAAVALGATGSLDPGTLAALERALGDAVPEVRAAARSARERLLDRARAGS
jgi:hypothetical protein